MGRRAPLALTLILGFDAAESWATDCQSGSTFPTIPDSRLRAQRRSISAQLITVTHLPLQIVVIAIPRCFVPEASSPRGRGIEVWAALRSRAAGARRHDRAQFCLQAAQFATDVQRAFAVLNAVVLTWCSSLLDDETLVAPSSQFHEDGTCWCGVTWSGHGPSRRCESRVQFWPPPIRCRPLPPHRLYPATAWATDRAET